MFRIFLLCLLVTACVVPALGQTPHSPAPAPAELPSSTEAKSDTEESTSPMEEAIPKALAQVQKDPLGGASEAEYAEEKEKDIMDANFYVSPGDELRQAARDAGYNITDLTLDDAMYKTDEELQKSLPAPLAEALISRRRKGDLRDRMIGMTFLGQPVPLDRRQRWPSFADRRSEENRQRLNMRSKNRPPKNFASARSDFNVAEAASPRHEILKPLPFSATGARIIFPDVPNGRFGRGQHPRNRPPQGNQQFPHAPQRGFTQSSSENRQPNLVFLGNENRHEDLSFQGPKSRPFGGPSNEDGQREKNKNPSDQQSSKSSFGVFDFKEENAQHGNLKVRRPLEDFPSINDNFGNSVGPDFGPVIYEFDANIQEGIPNSFANFDNPKLGGKTRRPLKTSASSPHPRGPNNFSPRPKTFAPSKQFTTSFANFGGGKDQQQESSSRNRDFPRDKKSECTQYTETICLDAENYPHADILASLEGDKTRTNVLIAEVRNQSADNLVDGVSARQEEQYDYTHYFGRSNRRQDGEGHRDFATDGGYLCPSEVKYSRPKRARNSKGEWKFIVNMDKYTQTIRMEKCILPGGACSYVSHHYQAMCNQVHNYQRLLSWEKKRGLHMDIFKVPSCCTCHIKGYSFVFPPLGEQRSAVLSRAGSNIVEQRIPGQWQEGDGFSGEGVSDRDLANMMPNGGPFTRPPHGRRMTSRTSAGGRTSIRPRNALPDAGGRRLESSASEEPGWDTFRGGNRRLDGGGGMDTPLSWDDMRRGDQPEGGRRMDRGRAGDPVAEKGGRKKTNRPAEDSEARQSSINYDYHPILQFFDAYQKK